jgi:hypothetical protein
MALDQAHEKLVDDIYLIPVMLDDGVPIPEQLQQIQAIETADGDYKEALSDAINSQLERLGSAAVAAQGEAKVRWSMTSYKDVWEGLPGHETSFQLLRFSSDEYPQAFEITEVVQGWLKGEAMAQRDVKFDQSPDFYNFGKDRFFRQHSWDASCGDPKIKERVLSIVYSIWWYGAGAAHPNQGFHTFAFTLDPVTQIHSLRDVFENPDEAFGIIQSEVRAKLLGQSFDYMTNDNTELRLDEEYVENGTKDWTDFAGFAFGDEAIEIFFGSYHVAPYAFGPQVASVEYAKVAKLMRKHYACALGIEHLRTALPAWPFEESASDQKPEVAAEDDGVASPSR